MNYENPAVIVGMGELGGSFARGLLRLGHIVIPVLRETDKSEVATRYPEPLLALVTTGEADLDSALADLPAAWKANTGLVQNELLPRNWRLHSVTEPTVAVVWFEKKPGRSESPIIPTPVAGPRAGLLVDALATIGIEAFAVTDADDMTYEMVRKNLYIITMNVGGMISGGTVHDLWYNHRQLAEQVARDVLDVQEWLTGLDLERERLLAGMVEAIDADPEHGTTGRSAPARLKRAIGYADQASLDVPELRRIAAQL
jgi:ketopantoate reductase